MSTTRGLQTCLEPQLVEPLTLAPHKEACDDSIKQDNVATSKKTGEFGGWSFIESLVKDDKGTPYVHPLDKSSSPVLSTRSLELCTESLGSETGSDIGDENDLYFSSSSSDSESRKSPARGRSRFCQPTHKKAIRRSFPPPLTSISGSDYVQYTPHREGGRLVIKATKIATAKACFQVERSDGRLRLRLKNSYNSSSSSEEDTDNDDEQVEERSTCLDDKDENTSSEDEMAIVKYKRPCSWYKASGHENKNLLNWKPFMGVAI